MKEEGLFLLSCLQQTLSAAALVEVLNAHKSLLLKKVPCSENDLNKHTDPEYYPPWVQLTFLKMEQSRQRR